MAGANLYSFTSELLQANKIKSDHKNNIMVQSSKSYIILDPHIKLVIIIDLHIKLMMAK